MLLGCQAQQRARRSGPRARSNGRPASAAPRRASSASLAAGRQPAEVDDRQVAGRRRDRSPAPARARRPREGVRSISCRRTTSPRLSPGRRESSGPRRRTASGHVVGGARRARADPGTRAAAGRRREAARPSRGTGSMRGRRQLLAAPPGAFDPLGQLRHRRVPRTGSRSGSSTRNDSRMREIDLRRQQRVPAQLEEVVLAADPLDAQHLRPDAGQHLLGRRRGRP